MASSNDNLSMALFCDFENVALGVRDIGHDKFDIRPVLERLLLKGNIVVKKAYCDWDRYKGFKAAMHEANFELIEIPHVRQSGKNSADIRMVVDALDLCYTKAHVNTFVIISGDSDFSPLVSKLRENAKQVIGVGVRQSTSDLLIANCDEFIFYDDLVRENQRNAVRREPQSAQNQQPRRSNEEEKRRREEMDARRTKGVELAVETFDALLSERGDSGKIWASVLKEAIKRRKPDFSESNYGFRAFGNLLEEASARGLLQFGRDEKSGAYVFRDVGSIPRNPTRHDFTPSDSHEVADATEQLVDQQPPEGVVADRDSERREPRRRSRGGRGRNSPDRQGADMPQEQREDRPDDAAPRFAQRDSEANSDSDSDFQPTMNMFSRPAPAQRHQEAEESPLHNMADVDEVEESAAPESPALDTSAPSDASDAQDASDEQEDLPQADAETAPAKKAPAKRPARPRGPRKPAAAKKSKE